MEGKQSERAKPGYCSIDIRKEKQRLLEPALQGPFKVLNEQGVEPSNYRQVIQVASMPFSLIRVSDKSLDIAVSFNPPIFSFKRDLNENSQDEL